MENRPNTSREKTFEYLNIFIEPQILEEFKNIDLSKIVLTTEDLSLISFYKRGHRLEVHYSDGDQFNFPYYFKNIQSLLDEAHEHANLKFSDDAFNGIIKTAQSIEKNIFSSVSLSSGKNVKDLWDEIIKKINSISNESHSLKSLTEKILDVPFLQKFESSIIILHLKGQTKAERIGIIWRKDQTKGLIEVKDFNIVFNSIKKSKIKSFNSELFPQLNLPFNGSFLAKEAMSKKYSMIAIVSRNDFLSYSKEEIDLFETCIDLLQPHFERLIEQEFSDKKISELRVCLKNFPLPLKINDGTSGASFTNDLYSNELQQKDIFFSKKIQGTFDMDLYDSDELRHYAFDLFHFQRISLLGELLNTLRHELSNPLFGLKLGAQLFCMMDVKEDDKNLMIEIEKNIVRCQAIIENFSNLYQIQNENKPISIKKIIGESCTLSKSESRELIIRIDYQDSTEGIFLNTPLIFVVQILFNLIVNASHATRNNTSHKFLDFHISSDINSVFIDLIDNGPGVPQNHINELFKPFFTTKSQGTGLGLVLSRNLALKMGGNLEYIQDNRPKGAHFRLTLPKS